MKVGQELDKLIAEHVLGHNVYVQRKGTIKERTAQGHFRPLRAYSKDIHAAWEVVEKLGITLIPIEGERWFALVGTGARWENPAEFLRYLQTADFATAGAAVGDSAPLTICIAAIKSVEKNLTVQAATAGSGTDGASLPH